VVVSIFSYLFSKENWICLKRVIPNHLTSDDDIFTSKQKCLQDFLQNVTPGKINMSINGWLLFMLSTRKKELFKNLVLKSNVIATVIVEKIG